MLKVLAVTLCILLFHSSLYAQGFVPCPGDPSIPIDDPACPPDTGGPPPGSSGSLNSSANSQLMDFGAKFVEEEISSRESEEVDDDFLSNKFGLLFGTKFSNTDQDTVDDFTGFESKMKGAFLGLDYRVNPGLFLGSAIDYVQENTDSDQDSGFRDMDEYGFSLYSFIYNSSDIYFSFLARYGWQNYDIEQSPGEDFNFDETLRVKGNADGSRINLSLGSGYSFNFDSVQIGVNALLESDRTVVDAHSLSSESGALDVEEDERKRLTFSLGGEASKVFGLSAGVFIPSVFANWVHEFKDDSRTINGFVRPNSLGIEEGLITVVTPKPDRNYFNVGANLVAILPNGFSAYIDYQRNIGQDNLDYWLLTIGGRVEF